MPVEGDPKSTDRHPREASHRHTQGRGPCEDGGSNWSDAAPSQGAPRIAATQQNPGRVKEGFSHAALKDSLVLLTP